MGVIYLSIFVTTLQLISLRNNLKRTARSANRTVDELHCWSEFHFRFFDFSKFLLFFCNFVFILLLVLLHWYSWKSPVDLLLPPSSNQRSEAAQIFTIQCWKHRLCHTHIHTHKWLALHVRALMFYACRWVAIARVKSNSMESRNSIYHAVHVLASFCLAGCPSLVLLCT